MEVALEIIDKFSRGEFPEGMMYWPDTKMYKDSWAKTIAAAPSSTPKRASVASRP